jgi:molybdate transport system substrate-binding protein
MASESTKMLSSMATREVLAELASGFHRETGCAVVLESAGGVDVARRVQAGETVDVVVLAAKAIDDLIATGRLLADSRVDIVRSGIAIAVAAGAAVPDVSTEAALKQAVLAAPTLSYSTGPSGVYLVGLFERWGIYPQIQPRIVQAPPGVPVGSLVAKGEVALGFQQLSELMHLPGIAVVGPMPPEVQSITTFSGAVASGSAHAAQARALLAFMTAPQAAGAIRRQGMEPA